jgi:two-component sensor histidine kinase
LVSNALKYAFADQPGEIAIELQRESEQTIVLTVRDNGIGLPADVELTQTDSLGLKLVKDLVNQLKGTIALDRDRGTAFRVTLNHS